MSIVISVENLGKKYLLSHQAKQESYVAIRDVIADTCNHIGRKLISPFSRFYHSPSTIHHSTDVEEFWALKGVSFEVKQGDRIGIIGRNGAGKSTLLKILSRITEPTSGSARIRGRVASLLEVGTGFHPELSGRENIFLNGAILGMNRAEIKKKFDEIVDFAEIEKFLDTPVKRYSSGMYVRLAFAVAAHLEPELLIVDEVLAVGDLQFQKKCLGKMEEVSTKEGRTVLFVSHNMQAISDLCNQAILFEKGEIIESGETIDVVNNYVNFGTVIQQAVKDLSDPKLRNIKVSNPMSVFKWNEIFMLNSQGACVNDILFGEPFEIVFRGYASEECENVRIGLGISSKRIGTIFTTHQFYNGLPDKLIKGFAEYRVTMDPNILAPGHYEIGIAGDGNGRIADYITNDALTFSISDAPYRQNQQWRSSINTGVVYYPCKWSFNVPFDKVP